jgi:hypothetical protein
MPFKSKDQMRWMFANHPEMAKRWAEHTKSIKSLPDSVAKEEKKAFAADVLTEVLKKAAAPIGFGAVAQPSLKPKTPTLSSVPNAPALPQQNSNQTQYGANGQEAVKQKAKQLQPAQNTKMSFLKKLAEDPPKASGDMPSRASLISRTPSVAKTSTPPEAPPTSPSSLPATPPPTPIYNDPVFRSANPQLARQMEFKALTNPPAPPVTLATLAQPKPAVPTMQAAPEVKKAPEPPKPPTGVGFGGLSHAMYPDGFSFNPGVPQATKNQNIHPAIKSETKPEAYANWGKKLIEAGGFDVPSAVAARLDSSIHAPIPGDNEETITGKKENRNFESNLLKNIYNMRQLFPKGDVAFLEDARQPIPPEKLLDLADKEQRIFSDYFKEKYPKQEPPYLFSLINAKKTPEQQKVLSDYMNESMQPRMARLSDNRQAEIGLMGDESNLRTAQGISELGLNRLSGVDYETLQSGSPLGVTMGLASSPLLLGMPLGSAVKALGGLAPAAVEGSSVLKGLEGASVLKPSTWLGAIGNTANRATRAAGRAAMDAPRFVAQHGTNFVKGINEAENVGNAAQGAATIYDPRNKDFQDTTKNIGSAAGYGYPTASFVAKGLLNAGKNIGNIPKLLGNFANYAKNNKMDLAEEALYGGLSYRDFNELPSSEKILNQQLGTPQQRTVFNYNNAEKFIDEAGKEPGSQRAAIVKTLLDKYRDLQDPPRTFSDLTNKHLPGLTATTQKLHPSDFKSQISPDLPGYTGASLDFKMDENATDQLRNNNIDERIDSLNNMPRSDLGVPTSAFQQKEEAEVNSVLQNTFGSNIGEYSKYRHAVKSVAGVRKEYDDVMRELSESNALENTDAIHITDPNLVAKAREVTTRYQDAMQKAAPVMVPFLTKSLDKRFEREIKPIQENAPQMLAQVNSIKEKIKQNQPLTEEDMANLETARNTAYSVKAYTVERMKLQFLRGQDLNAPEMHHLFSPGYESQEKAMDLISGAAAEDTSHYKKVVDPATGRSSYVSGFAKSSDSPASPAVVGANQPAPTPTTVQPMSAPPSAQPVAALPAAAPAPAPSSATSVKPPVAPAVPPPAQPQTVQNKPSKFQSLLSSAKEKLPEYKEKATVAFQQANDIFEKLKDKTNVPNPNANPVAQEAGRQLENRIKEEASPEVQQNPGVMQNMKSVFWDNLNTTEKTMLVSGLSLAAIAAVSSFSGDEEEGGSNILPLLGLIGATAGLAAPASKYFGFSNPLDAITGGGAAAAAPSKTTAGPLPPTKENVIKLVNEGKKPEAAKMFVGMLPFGGKIILRRALSNPGATPESLSSASYGKLDIPTATMVLDNKDYILPLLN